MDGICLASPSGSIVRHSAYGNGKHTGHWCHAKLVQKQWLTGYLPFQEVSVCCWACQEACICLTFSLWTIWVHSAAFAGVALFLVSMIEICFRAPLEPPFFSFDRFILFRNIPPGINMMTVPFVLGTVLAGKPDYFFYLCIVLGFVIFWFIPKQIKKKADDIVRIVTGYIFMTLSSLYSFVISASYCPLCSRSNDGSWWWLPPCASIWR